MEVVDPSAVATEVLGGNHAGRFVKLGADQFRESALELFTKASARRSPWSTRIEHLAFHQHRQIVVAGIREVAGIDYGIAARVAVAQREPSHPLPAGPRRHVRHVHRALPASVPVWPGCSVSRPRDCGASGAPSVRAGRMPLVAAAAARLGEALLREDGLTGGNAVCHQGIEERRAVVRHADARMIVQVTANSGKVDLIKYPSLISNSSAGPMPERSRMAGEPYVPAHR